jgi:hypothetical protein
MGDQAQLRPIIYGVAGRAYTAEDLIMTNVTQNTQNLSSPASAMNAVFSALAANDPTWYMQLVHPDERNGIIEYGIPQGQQIGAWVDREFPARLLITSKLHHLVRQFDYAGSTVVCFREANAPPNVQDKWLAFRREDNSWYVSDELNKNGFIDVLAYLKLSIPAFPSILPRMLW